MEDDRSIALFMRRADTRDTPEIQIVNEEPRMSEQSRSARFEQEVLPHLTSAYNLARWLSRNEHDAEEIVQEAYLRAFRFYDRFRGGDVRPWLLKIVRNVYYTRTRKNAAGPFISLDHDDLNAGDQAFADSGCKNPEQVLIERSAARLLRQALDTLPPRSREALVLRELEGMSYKEISTILEVPKGTVMSTLSRARARLRQSVTDLCEA